MAATSAAGLRTTSDGVSRFFDRYAVEFDDIYGNSNQGLNRLLNRVFRRSMRVRLEKSLEGCQPVEDRTVLDVGCGPGHYSTALALQGAAHVRGVDFAPAMVQLATDRAARLNVADRCHFELADVFHYSTNEQFDYSVVMGVMDYIDNAYSFVDKVLSLTRRRAMFSFPAAGGPLAWQRQWRYRRRCDLYLYGQDQLQRLMENFNRYDVSVERVARDYFVSITKPPVESQKKQVRVDQAENPTWPVNSSRVHHTFL